MARGSARARVSSTPSRIVVDGRAPLCPALAYSPPPYRPTPSKGYTRRRLTPRDFYFPFFHARAYVCIRIPRRGRCLRHRISLFPRSARSVAAALSLRCLSLQCELSSAGLFVIARRILFLSLSLRAAREGMPGGICYRFYFSSSRHERSRIRGEDKFLMGKERKKRRCNAARVYIYDEGGVKAATSNTDAVQSPWRGLERAKRVERSFKSLSSSRLEQQQ